MRAVILFLIAINAHAACRSSTVVKQFHKEQGYPKGRLGYIVDHKCPLACGGIDATINMQYQTVQEGKNKDAWERSPEGCASLCYPFNSTKERKVYNCKKKHIDNSDN